ncbi:hypothetical protein J5N97_014061 [Dioscorea zingiberensis]|uniref:Uncharacterized protein n=1 Tax=Dioscorea zingiberensis TaxID=325984 RepID=A0A9D5HJP5_9LILI|nr:hypothetical protein J5N97_014061 [Dioscorea zingiberensis]
MRGERDLTLQRSSSRGLARETLSSGTLDRRKAKLTARASPGSQPREERSSSEGLPQTMLNRRVTPVCSASRVRLSSTCLRLLLLFLRWGARKGREGSATAVIRTAGNRDKGDEVLLFDPAYETYETSISLAGGVPVDFVRALIQKAGVAAVPGCRFFHIDTDGESYQKKYIRFAFCKSEMTLVAAAQKMQDLVDREGPLQLE